MLLGPEVFARTSRLEARVAAPQLTARNAPRPAAVHSLRVPSILPMKHGGDPASAARRRARRSQVLKRTPLVNFFVFLVLCPPDADNLMEQVYFYFVLRPAPRVVALEPRPAPLHNSLCESGRSGGTHVV